MSTGSPSPDPFQMFCYATSYWKSAASLGRESNPLPYRLPWVILELLGLEIYMKCLLCLRGKPFARSHEVANLFAELSPDDKATIKKAFNVHATSNPKTVGVDLQAVLDRSTEVFTKARYGYEGFVWPSDSTGDRGSIGFSEAIKAMRDVIGTTKPTFAPECRKVLGVDPP